MSENFQPTRKPRFSKAAFRLLRIRFPLLGTMWSTTVIAGMLMSVDFQSRPGTSGFAPQNWPQKTSLAAPTLDPVVILFLHPYCPCSRVSLDVLNELLQKSPIPVKVQVVFFASRQFGAPVQESESWQRAEQLDGVRVVSDYGGTLARQFGALSSGWTVVYDDTGRLQFSGGITAGRGHAGMNHGSAAIAALLNGERVAGRSHCVFGCPLSAVSPGGEGPIR